MIDTGGVVFEAGRRHPLTRTFTFIGIRILCSLPMPRVVLTGPRCGRVCRDSLADSECRRENVYDFTADVRELVLERLRFDVYPEWFDPREGLACR